MPHVTMSDAMVQANTGDREVIAAPANRHHEVPLRPTGILRLTRAIVNVKSQNN